MPFRVFILFALCLTTIPVGASEETATDPRKPGVFTRFFNLFRASEKAEKRQTVNWKRLIMTMNVEPLPLKLGETRQMKVTLQLTSKSKRLVQLEFPTTQRIEVLVRNQAGKMVEQWSEDQAFANEPTLVTINPGERLEYSVHIATRDMAAGQAHTIIGYFPNFEQLKATKVITPEK
jgi:intracellular proteinase inhibitor BsuPI